MSTISQHLFTDTSTLSVREVVLSGSDQPQRHREKLARIILDEFIRCDIEIYGTSSRGKI